MKSKQSFEISDFLLKHRFNRLKNVFLFITFVSLNNTLFLPNLRLLNCEDESLMTLGWPELEAEIAEELMSEVPAGFPFIRIIFGWGLPSCLICIVCIFGAVDTFTVFMAGEVSLKSLFPASVNDNV